MTLIHSHQDVVFNTLREKDIFRSPNIPGRDGSGFKLNRTLMMNCNTIWFSEIIYFLACLLLRSNRNFVHWRPTRFLNTDKGKSDPFWALEINQILEHWKLTRFLNPWYLSGNIWTIVIELNTLPPPDS